MRLFRKNDGVVSVFLVLILVPVLLVSSLVIDASRVQLAEAEASAVGNLAANTLLSQYDEELNDKYGLMASAQDIENFYSEVQKYYNYAMSPEGSDFLRLMVASSSGVSVSEVDNATLANPAMVKKSIAEFMRFRGPMDDVKGLSQQIEKELEAFETLGVVLSMYESKSNYFEGVTNTRISEYILYKGLKVYYEEGEDIFNDFYGACAGLNAKYYRYDYIITAKYYNLPWNYVKSINDDGTEIHYTYEETVEELEEAIDAYQELVLNLDYVIEELDNALTVIDSNEDLNSIATENGRHNRWYQQWSYGLREWEEYANQLNEHGMTTIASNNLSEISDEKNRRAASSELQYIDGKNDYLSLPQSLYNDVKKKKKNLENMRDTLCSYTFRGVSLTEIEDYEGFESIIANTFSPDDLNKPDQLFKKWLESFSFTNSSKSVTKDKLSVKNAVYICMDALMQNVDEDEMENALYDYQEQKEDIAMLLSSIESALGGHGTDTSTVRGSGVEHQGTVNNGDDRRDSSILSTIKKDWVYDYLCPGYYYSDSDWNRMDLSAGNTISTLYTIDYCSKMFSYDTYEVSVPSDKRVSITQNPINAGNNDCYLYELEYILFGNDKANSCKSTYSTILYFLLAEELFEVESNSGSAVVDLGEGEEVYDNAEYIDSATGGLITTNNDEMQNTIHSAMLNAKGDLDELYNGGSVELHNGIYMSYLQFLQIMLYGHLSNRVLPPKYQYQALGEDGIYARIADVIQYNMTRHTGTTYNMKNSKLYFRISTSLEVSPMMLALDIFENKTDEINASTSWRTFTYETVRGY